jgi:hypothetical protein
MSFVFISHSQYDKTIKNWFKKAIDDGGLETILMEFELLRSDNPGPLIRDIINQSCIGLVVLEKIYLGLLASHLSLHTIGLDLR